MKHTTLAILLSAITACTAEDQLSTTSAPLTVVSQDCDVDAGYVLDEIDTGFGSLQIIGIYEARNSDAPWWADPECTVCLDDSSCVADPVALDLACPREPTVHPGYVHVIGSTTTLVLTSYEPTEWTVTKDASSQLARVIVSGYSGSSASVPEGVTVEVADLGSIYEWLSDDELALPCEQVHDASYCEAFGDIFAQERQAQAQAQAALVAGAEQLSGDKLRSFHGCYSMSNIEFANRDER